VIRTNCVYDDVRVNREGKANGGRVQVEVVLSWSAWQDR
jgi:hypothetical protein